MYVHTHYLACRYVYTHVTNEDLNCYMYVGGYITHKLSYQIVMTKVEKYSAHFEHCHICTYMYVRPANLYIATVYKPEGCDCGWSLGRCLVREGGAVRGARGVSREVKSCGTLLRTSAWTDRYSELFVRRCIKCTN